MNSKLKDTNLDELYSAVLTLKTAEECSSFFEDLCTINELLEMDQRFQVAKMLNEGHVYTQIAKATGASTATISRVNRSLNYGMDGYKTALERLKAK